MRYNWCMAMRLRVATIIVLLVEAVTLTATAATSQTIRGEVVDPAAFLRDGQHGSSVADQTYQAVDGGQTLALLDTQTQTLYLLLAERPGEDPNELLYDYANQQVKVTGTVYERGGVKGLVVSSVEPMEKPDAAATPPASAAPPSDTPSVVQD